MRISQTTGLPLDWTATQCAAFRGVTRQQWLDDVQNGLEPPDREGTRLWDAQTVRSWKRPDEWFAAEAAEHHEITVGTWSAFVRHGKAPQPVRKVGNRHVWKKSDVLETHLDIKPKQYVGPDPEASAWTGKECADYLGIRPRMWRAAVRAGDAPQPSGYAKDRTAVWDPAAVMAWLKQSGKPAAE